MKLVGLDFETANPCRGSICAAGVCLLEDGVKLAEREWLLRPHRTRDWFLADFTVLHGIHHWDVRQAPEFVAIWPVLLGWLQQADCVVIHNARFDLGQLSATLALYELGTCRFPYICSLQLSRRCFPELKSYTLDTVAAHLGHHFRHHDALEDAEACARIAVKTGILANCRQEFVFFQKPEVNAR